MRKPKLETVEMVKCEACGGYHPESESEIVVIRIVKGKNCDLNQANNAFTSPPKRSVEEPKVPDIDVVEPVRDILPNVMQKRIAENRAFMPMMLPPDHPDFESKGAKERRRV